MYLFEGSTDRTGRAVQVVLAVPRPRDERHERVQRREALLRLEGIGRQRSWRALSQPECIAVSDPADVPAPMAKNQGASQKLRESMAGFLRDHPEAQLIFLKQFFQEKGTAPGRVNESLVAQTLERLKVASVLDHRGESGRAREKAIEQHIRAFLPAGLGLESGFVIDAQGRQSRQVDLILFGMGYHAIFRVNGIPIVPVEAVIAVFEIKANVGSAEVLYDCYRVLESVKSLDRSNLGRNSLLVDRESFPVDPDDFRHFQLQVLGVVVAERSIQQDSWLDATSVWCAEHDRTLWPNMFISAKSFIGAYRTDEEPRRLTPDPSSTIELVTADEAGGESPLAWMSHEILNYIRVAKPVDYSPMQYLGTSYIPHGAIRSRPLGEAERSRGIVIDLLTRLAHRLRS